MLFVLSDFEFLSLDHNQVSTIPEWLSDLPSLKQLYLRNNLISSIPGSICRISHLTTLNLKGNNISSFLIDAIPESLSSFSLENNPLEPFFTYYSFCDLWRSRHFIPYITEKIQKNLPLDRFDELYPFYGKYRDILERAIQAFPTHTASCVQALLNHQDCIQNRLDSKILL